MVESTKLRSPTKAMVLAAGLGLRMRPLTQNLPKPLLCVGGRTMLDQALDRLAEVGVKDVVVNAHWLPEKIKMHLCKRNEVNITILEEKELLDTGGGVANALSFLGDNPFYVLNGDVVWRDGARSALSRLTQMWCGEQMDALLLLMPSVSSFGYEGIGDFIMNPLGQLRRRPECEVSPFVFTGVQLVHPRIFEDLPNKAFSMNLLYDRAINSNRLFGIVHDGDWFHVGTPFALEEADAEIEEREGARVRLLF